MPTTTEQQTVAVIGGGIVGSMAAYFLRREGFAGRIVVIERDPSYEYSSTARSAASVRTQFGCPINVQIGLFGSRFFKSIKEHFGADSEIAFRERGYLVLGERGTLAARRDRARMQRDNGATIDLYETDELAKHYPWLNVEDLDVGTFGVRDEGWLDAWMVLRLARRRAQELGVEYLTAEASAIDVADSRVTGVRTASGARVAANWVVNAAGPASGKVASWIGVRLPVYPRKRTVFNFEAPLDGSGVPMVFDSQGVWFRPEGDGFIGGMGPQGEDPDADGDFDPDHGMFEDHVWPALAHRVPALERIRVRSAWAGHYEVNTLDHNGVIGAHDEYRNFIIASGFSGHGVMQAPAAGRGVAELILHGRYTTLDLSPLGYERIAANQPMVETIVY